MEEIKKTIIWTDNAAKDLKEIYNFLANKSLISANRIIDKIITKPEILLKTKFYKMQQIDEYNPAYRRLIEGNYKIMYKELDNNIVVFRVFDSRQNPIKSL